MIKKVLSLLLFFILSQMVYATTYYVHKDLGSCSDSYNTTQAQNYGTPWCNMTVAFTNIVGGDTICVGSGNYNGVLSYQHKTINADIIIQACNGSDAWFSEYLEQYYYPNSLWTNLSNSEYTLYQTTTSLGYNSVNVYDDYGQKYITHKSMSLLYDRNFNGSLSNAVNNTILIRNTEPNFNPNKGGLYIASKGQSMYLANNRGPGKIIISGLKFKNHRVGVELYNQSNVIIENCTIYGGLYGIRVNGKTYGQNITIRNNFLNGNWSKEWYADITKVTWEETGGIHITYTNHSVFIHDNILENWGGGIEFITMTPLDGFGSKIYNNLMYGGSQSQLEIERYCSNSSWYNNTIIRSQMGASIGPSTAPPEYPCRFHHNTIHLPGNRHYDETGGDLSYPLKTYRWDDYPSLGTGVNGLNVTNWEIDHNTFFGKGYAYYGILGGIESNHYRERSAHNISWEYNIFLSETLSAVYGAGESQQNIFYDNNIYYSKNNYPIFVRWNNDSAANSFQTLYDALNSSVYDGTWDKRSKQINPFFYNVSSHDYRPINSSFACTIGAGSLPCITNEPLTCTTWTLNQNKNIDLNHDCKIISNQNIGTGTLKLYNSGEMTIKSIIKSKSVRLNGGNIKLSGSIRFNG